MKNKKMSIQIDKYCNRHNDIHLFSVIQPQLHNIYGFLFNDNDIYNGLSICLLDGEECINNIVIYPGKIISCHFGGFKPDSTLGIETAIEELFESLEAYDITIKDDEIFKVTHKNEEVDVNWFIENIYRKNTNRYYRKFTTFLKLKIFKRDLK